MLLRLSRRRCGTAGGAERLVTVVVIIIAGVVQQGEWDASQTWNRSVSEYEGITVCCRISIRCSLGNNGRIVAVVLIIIRRNVTHTVAMSLAITAIRRFLFLEGKLSAFFLNFSLLLS